VYSVADVVYYLGSVLGGRIVGVRRPILLLFLAQYERRDGIVVRYVYHGSPITRAQFFIWNGGVFSNEIHDVLDTLPGDDETPVTLYTPPVNPDTIPGRVASRIRRVAEEYAHHDADTLTAIIQYTLALDEHPTSHYQGLNIDEYLRMTGLGPYDTPLTSRTHSYCSWGVLCGVGGRIEHFLDYRRETLGKGWPP